jgi:hypothetical protein
VKLRSQLSLLAVASLIAATASACSDDPGALTSHGGPGTSGAPGDNPGDPNAAPAELQCTAKPQGRSYILFDNTKLEDTRVNENVGVNRARLKPFDVMKGEYQRVLGLVPASLDASASSFDAPPARWYAEAQHSGVSLNAIFDISFEGCAAYTKTAPEYAAAPTPESAATVCGAIMRKAWSRTASPDELASCTALATTKLAAEPDARKRWTYVCSSILSASQFLTF